MELPQISLKIELPYDPTVPHLGGHLEKSLIRKDTYTLVLIAVLFTIARSGSNLNVHQQ